MLGDVLQNIQEGIREDDVVNIQEHVDNIVSIFVNKGRRVVKAMNPS